MDSGDYNIANYPQHHYNTTANSPDMQNQQRMHLNFQNALNYASIPPGIMSVPHQLNLQRIHALQEQIVQYQQFVQHPEFGQYLVQQQMAQLVAQHAAQAAQSPPAMHFAHAMKPPQLMPAQFLPYLMNTSPPGLSIPITNLSPSVSPATSPPMEYTNQNNNNHNFQPTPIKLEPSSHLSDKSQSPRSATDEIRSAKRSQQKPKTAERKTKTKSKTPTPPVEPLSPPTSGTSSAESSPAAATVPSASNCSTSSSSGLMVPFMSPTDDVAVDVASPAPVSAPVSPAKSPATEDPAACLASPTAAGQRRGQSGPAKTFTCLLCNRSFGYKHVLQNHERTHTGEKPFGCLECNKRFTRDHHLKTHMRLHTGEKPYECEFCIRKFVQVANLRRHMRVHTGEKPYHCVVCKTNFADSNQLKSHRYKHITELPHECEFCANRFEDQDQMEQHHCKKGGSPSSKASRLREAKSGAPATASAAAAAAAESRRRAGKPRASRAVRSLGRAPVAAAALVRPVEQFPFAAAGHSAIFGELADETVADDMEVEDDDEFQTEPQDLTMHAKRSHYGSIDSDHEDME